MTSAMRPGRGVITITRSASRIASVMLWVTISAVADIRSWTRSSSAEMKECMERVDALEEEMKSAGAWLFSGRRHAPDTATVVRVSGGELLTTDGPFAESKEHLGGFYIIEAQDVDAALGWALTVTGAMTRRLRKAGRSSAAAFAATNLPHQLQAAINAVHTDATTLEQTDWSQIVRPVRPAACGRPHAGRGAQPRDRHRRGARARRRAGSGRTSVQRPGADGCRARLPQARWPSVALSDGVTWSLWIPPASTRRGFDSSRKRTSSVCAITITVSPPRC